MPRIPYYNLQGKRLPGSTTVISGNLGWSCPALQYWAWDLGMKGINYKEKLKAEADAGTVAHHLIDCEIKKIEPDFDQFLLPEGEKLDEIMQKAEKSLSNFKKWAKAYKLKILMLKKPVLDRIKERLHSKVAIYLDSPVCLEISLVSELYQVGITPDGVGFAADELAILDWKTSKGVYDSHLLQVSSYKEIWNEVVPEHPVKGMHILNISKESGAFHHHYFDDLPEEWEAFKMARKLHDLHKIIKRKV
jgi:hypothetical protein